ncbi:putative transposase [Trichonephila clavipes]|nr:putative transposase [Trichonephila clavipes]
MNLAVEGPRFQKPLKRSLRVRDLVRSDRRLSVRMIAEESNLNHTTVHQILTNELKMRKIYSKMNRLKGHQFGTLENIQTAVTDQLKTFATSEFHQCYEEWMKRLQRCVASESSYFEEDNVELPFELFGPELMATLFQPNPRNEM